MNNYPPKLLALDFDGVICDGLLEYFQTTQRCYTYLWPTSKPDHLLDYAEAFYRLRPVIETGWEMPLLLRALVCGVPEDEILEDWPRILAQLQATNTLTKKEVAESLDHVRDTWINTDLDHWLALHRFYPGVISALKGWLDQGHPKLYIVTTKEGRFVQTLLAQQGLELKPEQIIGKEINQPKFVTLGQLLDQEKCPVESLWFVEDLLKTLAKVAQEPRLDGAKLFLADWGYNTAAVRASIKNSPRFNRLSLMQFQGNFAQWFPQTETV